MDGTITRQTKVEYKKRRNPRAFKVWESNMLKAAMVSSAEIKKILEDTSLKEGISLGEMKPTTVSSEIMYLIVDSYLDLYKAVLAENLIKSGNPPSINVNIH